MCPDESKDMKVPVVNSGGRTTISMGEGGASRVTRVESEYTFAFELRNTARFMANSAQAIKEGLNTHWDLKAFVYGAIIQSYASLEAALNEIIHLHALESSSPLTEGERKVFLTIGREELQPRRESNTLQQYNLLLRIMEKPELKYGDAPYQAANLVRLLRNMLIHPIPGRVVTFTEHDDFDYSSQQDIVKKVRSHLKLGKEATFPNEVLTPKCASWAVSSCEAFLREFVVVSGIDPGFVTSADAEK